MKSFDEFNRDIESRSRYWTSDESHFAKEMYEEGQQSRQAEIDELQNKIDEALKLLNLAYPESWAYCVDEAINILKGEQS